MDKQALQAEGGSNFALLATSSALRQEAKDMQDDTEKQKDGVTKLSAAIQ